MLIGTLGYVMSELEDGKAFSEIVRAAKSLGYTEPGLDYDFIMSVGQYSYTPALYVNYIPENLKYCIPWNIGNKILCLSIPSSTSTDT